MVPVIESVALGQKCIIYTATKTDAARVFCYLRETLGENRLDIDDPKRKVRLHMGEGMTRVRSHVSIARFLQH